MKKIKIGSLVRNPFVSREHPCYELIYIGKDNTFSKCLDATLNVKKYYNSDFKDFEIIGECVINKKYYQK